MEDNAVKVEEKDIRDQVSELLKERGIMKSWLAQKLGISNSHLTFILQKKRDLIQEHIPVINELLGTSF